MLITRAISYKNNRIADSVHGKKEFSLLRKLFIQQSLLKRELYRDEVVSDLTQNMINSENFLPNFTISSSTAPYLVSSLATTSTTTTELDSSMRTIYMIAIVIMFLLVLFVISGRVIYSSNDSYSNMFYLKYHRNSSLTKAMRQYENSSSNFTGSKFELNSH